MNFTFGDSFLNMYRSGIDAAARDREAEQRRRENARQMQMKEDEFELTENQIKEANKRWADDAPMRALTKENTELSIKANKLQIDAAEYAQQQVNTMDGVLKGYEKYLPAGLPKTMTRAEKEKLDQNLFQRYNADQNSEARIMGSMIRDQQSIGKENQDLVGGIQQFVGSLPKKEKVTSVNATPASFIGKMWGAMPFTDATENVPTTTEQYALTDFRAPVGVTSDGQKIGILDYATRLNDAFTARRGQFSASEQKALLATTAELDRHLESMQFDPDPEIQGYAQQIKKRLGTFYHYGNSLKSAYDKEQSDEILMDTWKTANDMNAAAVRSKDPQKAFNAIPQVSSTGPAGFVR